MRLCLCFYRWEICASKPRGKKSYITDDKDKEGVDYKGSKEQQLIILHAITISGLLDKTDENGYPIDDLKWKMSHPSKHNEKLTCETLWVKNSHTGDYHNHINSVMFMQ